MSSKVSALPAGNANGALFYAVAGVTSSQVTGGAANGVAALDANAQLAVSAIAGLADVATSGAYGDLLDVPVDRISGTVALQLAGESLIWPNDVANGKIRLWNGNPTTNNRYYGFGIAQITFVHQVDENGSFAFYKADGSDNQIELFRIANSGDLTAQGDLHMSEKKIVNVGDPVAARDGVNLQTLDGRLTAAQRTAIDALTAIADPSTATAEDVANSLNGIISALQAT